MHVCIYNAAKSLLAQMPLAIARESFGGCQVKLGTAASQSQRAAAPAREGCTSPVLF